MPPAAAPRTLPACYAFGVTGILPEHSGSLDNPNMDT